MLREGVCSLNEFPRIDEALAAAAERLRSASESPRLDAELLLARALDVPRSYLFAHPEDCLDAGAVKRFSAIIDRRADGLPLAYITGEKEFWSMTLHVSPDTLVPRPETETLVDRALLLLPRRAELSVLDLGTGSGAIALAIARERPLCRIVATDISTGAIAVAQENARRHGLPNIEFRTGDWIEPVKDQRFDMIASNPPYIASGDSHLDKLGYEPRSALEAGADGMRDIRKIAMSAGQVLVKDGTLLLEHGAGQSHLVRAELEKDGWSEIEAINDMAGLPRVTTAVRR